MNQDDLDTIRSQGNATSNPEVNAAIVRLGEKRVLRVARRAIQAEVAKQGVDKAEDDEGKKRKSGGQGKSAKMGKMKLS